MESKEAIRESLPTIESLPPGNGEMESVYMARFLKKILELREMYPKEQCLEAINNFFDYITYNPLPANEGTREAFKREVEKLSDSLVCKFFVRPVQDGHDKVAYYEHPMVIRTRNLVSGTYSYLGYLFGISNTIKYHFPEAINTIASYLKNRLDGKRILNIGGGGSLEDVLTQISDVGPGSISPEIIVNIDPYLSRENIKLGQKKPYRSIDISGTDPNIQAKLEEGGCPKEYDEVWSLYSLPAYLFDPNEVPVFFSNIEKLLAPRGTARLHPLGIAIPSNQSEYTENNLLRMDKIRDETTRLGQLEEVTPSLLPIETNENGSKFIDYTLFLSKSEKVS